MFEPEDVLRGNYMCEDFDPMLIRSILDYLVPDNLMWEIWYFIPYNTSVYILAKQYQTTAKMKEKWYQTQYNVQPLSEPLLDVKLKFPSTHMLEIEKKRRELTFGLTKA